MKITVQLAPILLIAAPWQPASASDGGGGGLVQLFDLGLASLEYQVDAAVVALVVDEYVQGNVDLNGDGDTLDRVMHLHDVAAGKTINLGLAVDGPWIMRHGQLAFNVSEQAQAGTDLNGDGDTDDRVLHLYGLTTGTTLNLRLAAAHGGLVIGEGVLAYSVEEAGQGGIDLNGDGDAHDAVLHFRNILQGNTLNTGLAAQMWEANALCDGVAVFRVEEGSQGASDLNGDGDSDDPVIHVCHLASGVTTNLGLASADAMILPGKIAVSVWEASQGHLDLNGDGDDLDGILHIFDLATGTAANLGMDSYALVKSGTACLFLVHEKSQGGLDLDGDGDALDSILHMHDVETGFTLNLGLNATVALGGAIVVYSDLDLGQRLVLLVWESTAGGFDLNGDGDTLDRVLVAFDPVSLALKNFGLATSSAVVRGNGLFFMVDEAAQGSTDLNLDGDATDAVHYQCDLSTGEVLNLGLANWSSGVDYGGLIEVSEADQGVDLNGDGDLQDPVVFARDPATGTTVNLGLASWDQVTDEGLQAFRVSEQSQGETDLNGDGDTLDHILYLAVPCYPYGLGTDGDRLSLAAGGTRRFALDAGSSHAEELYLLLGTTSGTAAGVPLGETLLPLQFDPYLLWTLQHPNTAPLGQSLGVLDVMGEAEAVFILPPASPPALAGTVAHHAFLTLDPGTLALTSISNPAPLVLGP